MYMYFEKVNIVFLYIMQHLDTSGISKHAGVGRNTFLSSPHLCFITVFICDLFFSRDGPLMS